MLIGLFLAVACMASLQINDYEKLIQPGIESEL